MKLRFTHDYLGRETAMKQYRMGDTGDFSTEQALALIRMEVAEEVTEANTIPADDPEPVFVYTPKRRRQKEGDNDSYTS